MKMRQLAASLLIAATTLPALAQDPVVYHIDDMSLQAVSYTHLDVYKRQPTRCRTWSRVW